MSHDSDSSKAPIILISSCGGPGQTGDWVSNGGVKLYNVWVKLLRAHGCEAYIVTFDGKYHEWLLEHQPVISFQKVVEWKKEGRPLRFVTGWLDSPAFVDLSDRLYFLDCEISSTTTRHRELLEKLLKKKIHRIGTQSTTQQAWYMATFEHEVDLIREWSDETYWHPDDASREASLIGYMNEGSHTIEHIERINSRCQSLGISAKFIEIKGIELEVLRSMQRLDLFIGLNSGKHPLWGEGCPRSQQEAMHAGAILVAYDVKGNREYLIHGYTGFSAPPGNPELLAEYIATLLKNPELKVTMRSASRSLIQKCFTSTSRWPLVRDFLELNGKCVKPFKSSLHDPVEQESRRQSMSNVLRSRLRKVAGEKNYEILKNKYHQFRRSPKGSDLRDGVLSDIGRSHGTDKVEPSHTFEKMSYLDIYEKYLRDNRNRPLSVLEIGVKDGASLRMWKSYFKSGSIYGIDIDPRCREFEEDRIKIEIGSQDDTKFLENCFGTDTKFDLIIDDGSHVNSFTISSFEFLFNNRLNSGGIYIMEDLHCSYLKLQSNHNVLEEWPGMKYNDTSKNFDNDRKEMDHFFSEKIKLLDQGKGNIRSLHFWAMTCIILKI